MSKYECNCRAREKAKIAYVAFIPHYPFALEDLPNEQWRAIEGYNGDYQISTFGRVKSFKKGRTRILKPMLFFQYLAVRLFKKNNVTFADVHRLVAETFIPNPDNKPEVNHDDGNKFNCYVGNLFWVTPSENRRHAVRMGLAKSGVDCYNAKRTEEQVNYIRNNPEGLKQEELAAKFGMKQSQISEIQTGRRWTQAGGDVREPKNKRIADCIREEIKRRYKKGVVGCGSKALAREFGYPLSTIRYIIKH